LPIDHDYILTFTGRMVYLGYMFMSATCGKYP
jgi:hypothetical protein